jgi:hypothetical protein
MKKSRIRVVLYLLVFILFAVSVTLVYDTLALFETDTEANVENDLGRWIIKVSNKDITTGTSDTIVIDSFVYTQNSHVESGYIAPGGSAYFDLIIDATDCDVAVKYTLTLDLSDTEYEDNIRFAIDGLDTIGITRTAEHDYTGVISLDQIEDDETLSLRIYVYWDDVAAHNADDTEIGTVYGNSLKVPIGFHAIQYLGEQITAYTGE